MFDSLFDDLYAMVRAFSRTPENDMYVIYEVNTDSIVTPPSMQSFAAEGMAEAIQMSDEELPTTALEYVVALVMPVE